MSKPQPSVANVQVSLEGLSANLWGTVAKLSDAGLRDTEVFRQLDATGEMIDGLVKNLSAIPVPTELFNQK